MGVKKSKNLPHVFDMLEMILLELKVGVVLFLEKFMEIIWSRYMQRYSLFQENPKATNSYKLGKYTR